MPTTRRPLYRRRKSARAEAEAWGVMFECGRDYFSDLRPLSEAEARAMAPAAWARLGALHMQQRDPAAFNRARPWALETFGEPHADR